MRFSTAGKREMISVACGRNDSHSLCGMSRIELKVEGRCRVHGLPMSLRSEGEVGGELGHLILVAYIRHLVVPEEPAADVARSSPMIGPVRASPVLYSPV